MARKGLHREPDATRLAEHGRDFSTLIAHYPHGYVECCVPNEGQQSVVAAFLRAVYENGRSA